MPLVDYAIYLTMNNTVNTDFATIKIDSQTFSVPKNFMVIRNNNLLIPYNSSIFTNLGLTVSYSDIRQACSYETANTTITNYNRDIRWFKDGLTAYTSEVRSDTVDNIMYIPIESLLNVLSYNTEWDKDTITLKALKNI